MPILQKQWRNLESNTEDSTLYLKNGMCPCPMHAFGVLLAQAAAETQNRSYSISRSLQEQIIQYSIIPLPMCRLPGLQLIYLPFAGMFTNWSPY